MPRYKDRTDELSDLVKKPHSIRRIKSLILYQAGSPVEVGGNVYVCPSSLYFQIIPSCEEETYMIVNDIAAGDLSELSKVRSFLKQEITAEKKLVPKTGKRIMRIRRAKQLFAEIDRLKQGEEINTKYLANRLLDAITNAYIPLSDDIFDKGYLGDFHMHRDGTAPSSCDLEFAEETVISFKLRKSGSLYYCSVYYIHEKHARKLITFDGGLRSF